MSPEAARWAVALVVCVALAGCASATSAAPLRPYTRTEGHVSGSRAGFVDNLDAQSAGASPGATVSGAESGSHWQQGGGLLDTARPRATTDHAPAVDMGPRANRGGARDLQEVIGAWQRDNIQFDAAGPDQLGTQDLPSWHRDWQRQLGDNDNDDDGDHPHESPAVRRERQKMYARELRALEKTKRPYCYGSAPMALAVNRSVPLACTASGSLVMLPPEVNLSDSRMLHSLPERSQKALEEYARQSDTMLVLRQFQDLGTLATRGSSGHGKDKKSALFGWEQVPLPPALKDGSPLVRSMAVIAPLHLNEMLIAAPYRDHAYDVTVASTRCKSVGMLWKEYVCSELLLLDLAAPAQALQVNLPNVTGYPHDGWTVSTIYSVSFESSSSVLVLVAQIVSCQQPQWGGRPEPKTVVLAIDASRGVSSLSETDWISVSSSNSRQDFTGPGVSTAGDGAGRVLVFNPQRSYFELLTMSRCGGVVDDDASHCAATVSVQVSTDTPPNRCNAKVVWDISGPSFMLMPGRECDDHSQITRDTIVPHRLNTSSLKWKQDFILSTPLYGIDAAATWCRSNQSEVSVILGSTYNVSMPFGTTNEQVLTFRSRTATCGLPDGSTTAPVVVTGIVAICSTCILVVSTILLIRTIKQLETFVSPAAASPTSPAVAYLLRNGVPEAVAPGPAVKQWSAALSKGATMCGCCTCGRSRAPRPDTEYAVVSVVNEVLQFQVSEGTETSQPMSYGETKYEETAAAPATAERSVIRVTSLTSTLGDVGPVGVSGLVDVGDLLVAVGDRWFDRIRSDRAVGHEQSALAVFNEIRRDPVCATLTFKKMRLTQRCTGQSPKCVDSWEVSLLLARIAAQIISAYCASVFLLLLAFSVSSGDGDPLDWVSTFRLISHSPGSGTSALLWMGAVISASAATPFMALHAVIVRYFSLDGLEVGPDDAEYALSRHEYGAFGSRLAVQAFAIALAIGLGILGKVIFTYVVAPTLPTSAVWGFTGRFIRALMISVATMVAGQITASAAAAVHRPATLPHAQLKQYLKSVNQATVPAAMFILSLVLARKQSAIDFLAEVSDFSGGLLTTVLVHFLIASGRDAISGPIASALLLKIGVDVNEVKSAEQKLARSRKQPRSSGADSEPSRSSAKPKIKGGPCGALFVWILKLNAKSEESQRASVLSLMTWPLMMATVFAAFSPILFFVAAALSPVAYCVVRAKAKVAGRDRRPSTCLRDTPLAILGAVRSEGLQNAGLATAAISFVVLQLPAYGTTLESAVGGFLSTSRSWYFVNVGATVLSGLLVAAYAYSVVPKLGGPTGSYIALCKHFSDVHESAAWAPRQHARRMWSRLHGRTAGVVRSVLTSGSGRAVAAALLAAFGLLMGSGLAVISASIPNFDDGYVFTVDFSSGQQLVGCSVDGTAPCRIPHFFDATGSDCFPDGQGPLPILAVPTITLANVAVSICCAAALHVYDTLLRQEQVKFESLELARRLVQAASTWIILWIVGLEVAISAEVAHAKGKCHLRDAIEVHAGAGQIGLLLALVAHILIWLFVLRPRRGLAESMATFTIAPADRKAAPTAMSRPHPIVLNIWGFLAVLFWGAVGLSQLVASSDDDQLDGGTTSMTYAYFIALCPLFAVLSIILPAMWIYGVAPDGADILPAKHRSWSSYWATAQAWLVFGAVVMCSCVFHVVALQLPASGDTYGDYVVPAVTALAGGTLLMWLMTSVSLSSTTWYFVRHLCSCRHAPAQPPINGAHPTSPAHSRMNPLLSQGPVFAEDVDMIETSTNESGLDAKETSPWLSSSDDDTSDDEVSLSTRETGDNVYAPTCVRAPFQAVSRAVGTVGKVVPRWLPFAVSVMLRVIAVIIMTAGVLREVNGSYGTGRKPHYFSKHDDDDDNDDKHHDDHGGSKYLDEAHSTSHDGTDDSSSDGSYDVPLFGTVDMTSALLGPLAVVGTILLVVGFCRSRSSSQTPFLLTAAVLVHGFLANADIAAIHHISEFVGNGTVAFALRDAGIAVPDHFVEIATSRRTGLVIDLTSNLIAFVFIGASVWYQHVSNTSTSGDTGHHSRDWNACTALACGRRCAFLAPSQMRRRCVPRDCRCQLLVRPRTFCCIPGCCCTFRELGGSIRAFATLLMLLSLPMTWVALRDAYVLDHDDGHFVLRYKPLTPNVVVVFMFLSYTTGVAMWGVWVRSRQLWIRHGPGPGDRESGGQHVDWGTGGAVVALVLLVNTLYSMLSGSVILLMFLPINMFAGLAIVLAIVRAGDRVNRVTLRIPGGGVTSAGTRNISRMQAVRIAAAAAMLRLADRKQIEHFRPSSTAPAVPAPMNISIP